MSDIETHDGDVLVPRQTAAAYDSSSGEWHAVAMPEWDLDYPIESVAVANTVIALGRVGNKVYAFADQCTHQRCNLSEGDVDDFVVTCPCHNGSFDMRTGEVVSGPPPSPVQTYECHVDDDVLQIRVPATQE